MVKNNKSIKNHKILTKRGYIIHKQLMTQNEIDTIKTELTVKPLANENYGEQVKSFTVYKENEDTLCIPRYYGIQKYGDPLKTTGMSKSKINISFNGELRDIQLPIVKTAIDTLKNSGGGILQLYCGCGKTVIALKIAALLGLKTLIIVHKTFLQNQWYDRIKQFTDAKVGLIKRKKIDIDGKDIIVGMLQSISMIDYDLKIFDDIQLVICDEVHHFASRVFSNALYKVGSKYTLGLSATPHRGDGLTKVLYWYLGPIMYKLERPGDKSVVVKTFHYHTIDKNYVEKKSWLKGKGMKPNQPKMITCLQKVTKRNIFMINILEKLMMHDERKILVLSDRIEHLTSLKESLQSKIDIMIQNEELEQNELTTSYYIGKMKEYERADAAHADIIFATYAMAAEGLDIPELNTVLFATPKKNIIQSVGRILRKQMSSSDINPLIIDIWDHYSMFNNQADSRNKYYKKKKYTINNYYTIDSNIVTKEDYMKKVHGESCYDLYMLESENEDDTYDIDLNKVLSIGQVVYNSDNNNLDSDSDEEDNFDYNKCMFTDD